MPAWLTRREVYCAEELGYPRRAAGCSPDEAPDPSHRSSRPRALGVPAPGPRRSSRAGAARGRRSRHRAPALQRGARGRGSGPLRRGDPHLRAHRQDRRLAGAVLPPRRLPRGARARGRGHQRLRARRAGGREEARRRRGQRGARSPRQAPPRAARLAVRVPEGAEGVEIVIDDRPVSAALADAPLLVDPGPHHVVVRAQPRAILHGGRHRRRRGAGDGERRPREQEGCAARPEPRPAAPPPAAEAPKAIHAEAPRATPAEATPDRWRGYLAGGVTAGVGVGALVSGLVAHARFQEFLIENGNPKPGSRPARERSTTAGRRRRSPAPCSPEPSSSAPA